MPLSVIGAGYGRTGTKSLQLALEQLGFGPCYHMTEVFKNPEAAGWWADAADGKADWDRLLAGYASNVDWPGATFWREQAEAFPEAKVILTVRDPESWFRSTQETIFQPRIQEGGPPVARFGEMIHKVVHRLFDGKIHDHDTLVRVFEAHNAKVRATIPPERLLVYEVAQGWEPLCDFLGVPAPDAPMPRANTTEDFKREILAPTFTPS
jgi:hypothetical protein